MIGEELSASYITKQGLLGDRAYGILDSATGKVASAKHPRKWGTLFDCRAAYVAPPVPDAELPPIWITLPKGRLVASEQDDIDEVLSTALGRVVVLSMNVPATVKLEEYRPDNDMVTEEPMAPGTFFDGAAIHILTTSSLERVSGLYQEGRFEVRRFRPNIVIQSTSHEKDFVEDSWIGHELVIGEKTRLAVIGPCTRCVMITMSQGDLPKDPGILRTVAKHNHANLGVYASVLCGGTIQRGDPVTLA
jgi:uncharacterized protein YcbX